MTGKRSLICRADYRAFSSMDTRWADNDIYGHVNNVAYYAYFDSAVNRYLIEQGGLDIHAAPVVGFVVQSSCNYRQPIAYPQRLEVGLRVNCLSRRSVTYGVAIFRWGEDEAVAWGDFVHVFVDRASRSAVAIPERIRAALEQLMPECDDNAGS